MAIDHYKCKKDNTHDEIKSAFYKLGYSVVDIHSLKGMFDLIALKNGHYYCIECKSHGGKLSDQEVKFHRKFDQPIYIIESAQQVFDLVNNGIYNEPERITKQLND